MKTRLDTSWQVQTPHAAPTGLEDRLCYLHRLGSPARVKPTARFGGEVHQLHGGLWAVAGHDGPQDFKGTLDYIWFSPEAAHRAGLHFAPGVTCGGDHASGRRTRAEEGEKLDAWS